MDTPITRAEHEEFRRTVNAEIEKLTAEDARINSRLQVLEKNNTQINALTLSLQKLTDNVDNMCKIQNAQGERLETLEEKPAKNWNALQAGIISAIAAAIGSGIVAAVVNAIVLGS